MAVDEELNERDATDEWRIAPARQLTSVAEMEGRIDVALATARTAEEAALEIGAASLEAAEQARRAAGLAERASASAAAAAERAHAALAVQAAPAPTAPPPVPDYPLAADAPPAPVAAGSNGATDRAETVLSRPRADAVPRRPDPFEDRLTAFRLRAERVMIRLQKLELGSESHEPTEVIRLKGRRGDGALRASGRRPGNGGDRSP